MLARGGPRAPRDPFCTNTAPSPQLNIWLAVRSLKVSLTILQPPQPLPSSGPVLSLLNHFQPSKHPP